MSDDVTAMLARVRELDEAATPGPWVVRQRDWQEGPRYEVRAGHDSSAYPITGSLVSDRERQDSVLIAESRTLLPAIAAELEAVRAGVMALAPVRVSINDWPSSECPCCEAQGPALADMLDLPHTDGCLWVRCGGVRRG